MVARFSLFLKELAQARADVPPTPGISLYLGTGLVALGVLVTVLASLRHRKDIQKLRQGRPLIENHEISAGEVFGYALGLLGIAMVVYLFRLGS